MAIDIGGPEFVLLGVTAASAVTDARTGRIPNALTLPALASGLATALWQRGAVGLVGAVVGALACAVVPGVLFSRGAMGGGDVKLLAAAGALVGPVVGLEVQCTAYVATALYVLVVAVARGRLGARVVAAAALCLRMALGRRTQPGEGGDPETIRLGVFIFAAASLHVGLLARSGR
jgi:prepilin peptidase CpaA